MQLNLSLHLLPTLTEPAALADSTVVVVDVLRATTTITTALAAGAASIVPCLDIEAVRRRARESSGPVLLGGERRGVRIDGFDLGNSPGEYRSEVVQGKTILFTTTNGTRALDICQQATRVLLAGFVNLQAIVAQIIGTSPLHILCAGTDGEISQEDTLLAGALIDLLSQRTSHPLCCNDQARIAQCAWRSLPKKLAAEQLETILRHGAGGQNLLQLGLENDIHFCAQLDRYEMVPSLDQKTGAITSG